MLKSWVFWTSASPFQWFWMFFLPIAGCLLGCVWWFSHQRAWGFADWVYKCHGHLTEWLTLCDRYWAEIIFLSLVHLHLFTLNYCIFGMMSKIFSFLLFFFCNHHRRRWQPGESVGLYGGCGHSCGKGSRWQHHQYQAVLQQQHPHQHQHGRSHHHLEVPSHPYLLIKIPFAPLDMF